jgi:acetyl esterase/lipase
MKKNKKKHFYQRKLFRFFVILIAVILLILLAFRVSPWPGAFLIRAVFNHNSGKVLTALEKHQPDVPVTTLANQQYQEKDNDAFLDVYYPSTSNEALPTIIWTHGGAWLSGDKDNAAPYFKILAAKGFAVVALDYSLAPVHPYPKGLHQLNQAHTFIVENAERFHVDTSNIIFAGDSAGSQLSSQLAALITNPAYADELAMKPSLKPEQLKGVILFCGIYQMAGLTQPDPTLPKIIGWGDDISVWAYTGTKDFSDPIITQMSPYFHVTKDFPATFISGGNGDPLTKAQSVPLANQLEALGVSVTRLFYKDEHQPSLPHEYQFNLDNTDGTNALEQSVEFAHKITK